jgi:hypothetical protein
MALPDPIITRRVDRLTIRFPVRPHRGTDWIKAILFCLPFFGFGGLMVTSALNPDLWGGHGRVPVDHSVTAKIVGVIWGGIFILIAMPIVTRGVILRFGHSEIVLARGRIRSIERAGFLFLTSSRSLATLTRLDIVKPPFEQKSDVAQLRTLEAYFSDGMPFRLASMYSADTLKPIAKELLGAIPNHGGAKTVVFAGPPPVPRASAAPTIVPPPQRGGKPSRLLVEHGNGSTRVTLPPSPWHLALFPSATAMAVSLCVFIANFRIHRNNPTMGLRVYGLDPINLLVPLMALAGVAVTVAMRTRYVFETDRDGLRIESQSVLRRSVRRWTAADIERLFVETRTIRSSKGGSGTTRVLMLLLKNGKRKRVPCSPTEQNLDWICQTLNTRLQNSGTSTTRPGTDRRRA